MYPVDNHFRRPLLKLLEPGEVLRVSLGAGLIVVFTEFDAKAGGNLEAEAHKQQGVHSERERILSIIEEVMPSGIMLKGYKLALIAKIKGE